MTLPIPGAVPFTMVDGWPERLPHRVTTLRETGIFLGSVGLLDFEFAALRRSGCLSIRVDDHPEFDGWTTLAPTGEVLAEISFEIPTTPVSVPARALTSPRHLEEWVSENHGASGRLLLWDSSCDWWIAHDPDLEIALICAPPGRFRAGSDEVCWWDFGSPESRDEVERLRVRYAIEPEVD